MTSLISNENTRKLTSKYCQIFTTSIHKYRLRTSLVSVALDKLHSVTAKKQSRYSNKTKDQVGPKGF